MNYLLSLLVLSTIFERFNVFITSLDFSLKLSLILLPVVGLLLLYKRRLTFNPTFLFPFLAAVAVIEALSILPSYDRFQSFQAVVFRILMIGLFYLFVWALAGRRATDSSVDTVCWGWLAGALVVSLFGFWQFWRYLAGQLPAIFLDRILDAKSLGADAFVQTLWGRLFLRPSSTFIDTNTAASFVGIAILLGLGLLGSNPKVLRMGKVVLIKKGLPLLPLLILLTFFAMTLSRSAILGLAAGLIVFAVLNLWGRINKKITVTLVLTFLVLVGLGTGWLSLLRVEPTVARIKYVQAAIAMFKHNPLLGVGAGNFERYYTKVIAPTEQFGYSHSIFLTWIGETGTLGLVANLALIGVVVLLLGREILRHPIESVWRVRLSSLLAAFVALVVANIFHAHYGLEFTWALLGLCVSGYYLAKGKRLDAKGKINILGVGVDNVAMSEAVGRVKGLLGRRAKGERSFGFAQGKQKGYVVTPNPEMVMLARRDPSFREILNKADLAIPDGIGLVWASRILGTPLAERVAGRELFLKLCAEAARRGGRIFLLGAVQGVAEKAARQLKRRYPKLRIAGTFAGDGRPRGDRETVAAINQLPNQPIDLLFVAYGHGKQEKWIARNLEKIPVKVAMGVGGAFDFVAGSAPGVPRVVERLGFEWLYRLIRQPWRLRRQLVLIPFATLLFKESLRNS